MAKNSVDTEKYAGSGRLGSAFGESNLYGIGGTAVGAGIGAAAGATVLSKSGPLVTRIGEQLARLQIPLAGKAAGIVGLTYAGAIAGSLFGSLAGMFIGVNKASKAKKQFNQLKTERDTALAQLEAVQTVSAAPRRFADGIQSRTTQGSYAAAVQADRAAIKRER